MVQTKTSPTRILPILESGDRLSRAEFERRYALVPDNINAELIEGVVYVAAALRYNRHGVPHPHSLIIIWLGTYGTLTSGVQVADNATVRLDDKNEPQPDVLLRVDENNGGQSRISEDDYVEGAPELIVEIASSSASYDLHDKLTAYQRNGVREYLVWLVEESEFRWYVLDGGKYRQQKPDRDLLSSPFFPGLRLDVSALLSGDMAKVLSVLQSGLQS